MHELPPSQFFPPADDADEDGLIGIGGSLDPDWLLDAYAHGIFPWPMGPEYPTTWFSPDPRGIIELDHFHVPRRLRRTINSGRFEISMNRSFTEVMRLCATGPDREGGVWITEPMIEAYTRLHQLGHAHSLECRNSEGVLVGGIYGVAVRGLFAGESMFHRERDASKVALVALADHLRRRGYKLFDIQMITSHTEQFGAIEIPREEYLERLAQAMQKDISFT